MTSAFEMDSLQLYLGEQYVINDNIIIKQPKLVNLQTMESVTIILWFILSLQYLVL